MRAHDPSKIRPKRHRSSASKFGRNVPNPARRLAALRFWRCESYDGDAFLAADVFVRCDGARYASWRPYAALMVCVYPVGIRAELRSSTQIQCARHRTESLVGTSRLTG